MTTSGGWPDLFEESIRIHKNILWELDRISLNKIKVLRKNPFWKDAITICAEFKELNMENVDGRSYPLWGSFVMENNKLKAHKEDLIEHSILHVNDLLSLSGNILG